MTNIVASLPVDPTGSSSSNYITSEYQQIAGGAHAVIRPNWGAFFKDSLQIYSVNGANGLVPMTYGTDYLFAELDTNASESTGKVVYQAIMIVNPILTSTFSLTYQAYGGMDNQNKALIYTNANIYAYGAAIDYASLTGKPAVFPPVYHTHDLNDIYGMGHVSPYITWIGTALINNIAGNNNLDIQYRIGNFVTASANNTEALSVAINQHIANSGYSHGYTPLQIGLGNVQNYGFTNPGGGLPYYASPTVVAAAIASPPAVDSVFIAAHIANVSNPHSDTAAEVGLGNVANYAIQTTYSAGQYTTLLASNAPVVYLGPYALTQAVSEFSAAQHTTSYTNAAALITNGTTGLLDRAAATEAAASAIIAASTNALANISTNESTAISNSNTTVATIKRYGIVYNNAEYAAMLTLISQYDYARGAVNASVGRNGYWPVPSNLDGLYLWLSANNPQNTLFSDSLGALRVTALVDQSSYGRVYSAAANNAPHYKASTDIAAGASGIINGYVLGFGPGHGLVQSYGQPARLKPGMSVFAIYKTPIAGKVFNLLSSQSTGMGINVFGNSTNALVEINSTGWEALRAPPSTQVANTSTLFCGVISAADETASWCVANTDVGVPTYPRGVNTPVTSWPTSSYMGDPLDLVGNTNYGIANSGELAELIIYNRALSGAEAASVLEYLRLRYNHSTALATDYTSLNAF